MFDVIVIGGSYAGMAGALQLARARRAVAVVDAGQRRNRFAQTSHGLLGQDGATPSDIHAAAKAQLLAYPTVTWVDGIATSAARDGEQFTIFLVGGEMLTGKRVILATGVRDELPDIPGLAERWGTSVFHCPYCHGYELNEGPIGVLATGEMAVHQASMLPDWGPTTLFTNGALDPDADQRALLERRKVEIEPALITGIRGTATICLQDGREHHLAGLFVAPRLLQASPLAEQLGCEFVEGPMGPYISTGDTQETSVEGVFAAGDAARLAGSLTFAIADGAMAGLSAHRSLMFGDRAG